MVVSKGRGPCTNRFMRFNLTKTHFENLHK